MAQLSEDDGVRAVVIAARGPHFSVGLDLKAMGPLLSGGHANGGGRAPSPARRAMTTRRSVVEMQAAITSVAQCAKPVVATVHGYCIGGGVDLVTACDIRLASSDAVFSVRETKVAIVADLGSLQRLPRIIGAGHVAELALTGKDIDAARAMRIGLVNDVLADADACREAGLALAGEIAANSPLAVQGTKAVLAANDGRTVAEGLDYVATWNSAMLGSDDLTEAMAAFVEKRPPKFTGS
jgi:enoyl-CoA hydratase